MNELVTSESRLPIMVSEEHSQKPESVKKTLYRGREPANDLEQVEKAYLQNWDMLYTQKYVKTPDPIVNWGLTRSLLKKHFKNLKLEQIIKAINNGMMDNFIMQGGYSLSVMLSTTVLNRLINSTTVLLKPKIAADYISDSELETLYKKSGVATRRKRQQFQKLK